MTEIRRMTSTAARINRSFMLRLICLLFATDLLVLFLAVCGWCVYQEVNVLGSAWHWNIERSFSCNFSLPWFRIPSSVQYTFRSALTDQGAAVHGGRYFTFVSILAAVMLAIEILMLISEYRMGKRRTQKLLTPLQEHVTSSLR